MEKLSKRFIFADNIRFWCMFAVVALHSASLLIVPGQTSTRLHDVFATIFKFGTIGFFLISGFLLGKGVQSKPALPLLRTRIRKVFLPWCVWFLAFVAVRTAIHLATHHEPFVAGINLSGLFQEASYTLTNTSTWFVPNLIFSLAVLLLFGRYLHTLFVGAALLAANLAYTANIYGNWFTTTHTRALFGFVFYLWLGHQTSLRLEGFQTLLSRIPHRLLLGAAGLAGLVAFAEAQLLVQRHSADPMNTLRLSNQIYSVAVVLCLYKLRRPAWPAFVNVSRDIFGIYLSHTLIVSTCLTVFRLTMERPLFASIAVNSVTRVLLWAIATAASWSAGLLLTRVLARNRFTAWVAGTQIIARQQDVSRTSGHLSSTCGLVPLPLQPQGTNC